MNEVPLYSPRESAGRTRSAASGWPLKGGQGGEGRGCPSVARLPLSGLDISQVGHLRNVKEERGEAARGQGPSSAAGGSLPVRAGFVSDLLLFFITLKPRVG